MYWKYSSEDGPFGEVVLNLDSDNLYIGEFPNLNSNSIIEYYIKAINVNGASVSHPNTGWHIFSTIPSISGDINQDSNVDILDAVLAVNLVLENEFNYLADLNLDSSINILDIIQIINIILNQN